MQVDTSNIATPASKITGNYSYTKKSSLSEDQILAELLDRADNWLWETVIAYGGKPHTPLVLNGEWQNCGYKQAYIGNYGFYPDGKPYVRLTYNNFKYGGIKQVFSCKDTYSQIINDHKAGKSYTPKTRNVTQENQIGNEETLKQILKEDMLKQFLASDKALWDDGTENLPYLHSYWKSKGFTENIVDPSIRYVCIEANRFNAFPEIAIMAKVIAIDGELKGFQKIYDSGRKELTQAMSKKGNFITLGIDEVLPEKLKEVFTSEGLATGASVRQALDRKIPIVITLDAGNIENVVSELRTKYGTKSKCSITIVADNDYWKTLELDPVTNKPKTNAGLSKAHPVALRHRCKIVSPNFEGLDTSKLPTDFNDLHKIVGLNEVKQQLALAKKPNLHLAITQESLDQERKRIWSQFLGHKVITINERYIPNEIPDLEDGIIRPLAGLVFSHKVSLFKCPKDTGKTTVIGKLLKQNSNYSTLFITHRVSLATNISNRLGVENYADYQGINSAEYAQLHELRKLSICLNSLFKLLNKDDKLIRSVDIVVIDEISQVLRSLTSMHVKNKVRVMSALKQLIQSAKHLICMDADLDSVTLNVLKDWLPNEKYFVLLNQYQPAKDKNIILYNHPGMIIDKAIETIENGQRALVVTNCKRQARQLYLAAQKQDKKHLYISGDNPGDIDVKLLFENVNREAPNYDLIVTSPSVSSGISIDEDIFGFVGGIFEHNINTPSDCLQALARPRKAKTFHAYVSDIKQTLPTEENAIAAKWLHSHKHDQNLLSFEDLGNDQLLDIAQDYRKLCISATREANFAKQDFLARFVKLAILEGYKIAYSDSTPELEDHARFLQSEAKDLEDIEFIKGRASSKTVSDEEKEVLKEKPRKTLEETWQLDKKEILDFYVLDENTPQEIVEQVITEDRRGKTRKEITNLEIAVASDAQIQKMRKDEAKAGITLDPDRRAFATEREIYQQILTIAGVDTELISNNSQYSAETLLTVFVPWILSNYLVLKGIFPRLATPEQIENDPIRVFGSLLRRLGLSHSRVGTTKDGQYMVNVGRLEKMKELLLKRGKIPKSRTHNANNIYIQHLFDQEILPIFKKEQGKG
jgi:hypothetical protein